MSIKDLVFFADHEPEFEEFQTAVDKCVKGQPLQRTWHHFTNADGKFYVTWTAVPEAGGTGADTFQVCLDINAGTIECNYGAMTSIEGIAGYSPGHGVHDPGGTDITAIPALLEKLAQQGLPNLYLPRRDGFVRVDALPLLGTGKTDLRAVKRIAREALDGR